MKKMRIAILLVYICTLFGSTCLAQDNTYVDGDWIYSTETNKIVAYNGKDGRVVIPPNSTVSDDVQFGSPRGLYSQALNDYVDIISLKVSENAVFEGKIGTFTDNNLKEVIFENNAEDMPKLSIYLSGCENLKTLKLPEGLEKIELGMCSGCSSLTKVEIPDSVTVIGNGAFEECSALPELRLPNSLVSLGDNVTYNCRSLSKLYIPDSVDYTKIYVPANLKTVEFQSEPKYTRKLYHHFLHTDWMKNTIFPKIKEDFLIADGYLIKYFGNEDNIVIPNNVKIIDESAFDGSGIKSVIIPNTVNEIGECAFNDCSKLTSLTIPKSVKIVRNSAFSECTALSELTIEGNTEFEDCVFYKCLGLRDESIKVTGKILYTKDKFGTKSDPFQFTKTSYTQEPYNDDFELVKTSVPINLPVSSPDPNATTSPKPEITPLPTSAPTASPVPQTLIVEGGEEIAVKVNGTAVKFPDAKPFIDENDRTQVPVRAVAEMLDCKVDWNGETQTVTITKDGEVITLVIGEDVMSKNGEQVKMDTKAMIKEERTYIPVRFVAEALGLEVEYK